MKKIYSIFLLLLLGTLQYTARAQAPENVNYQAIARDTAGNPLANTSLIVQLSLLSASPSGALVWQEKHTLSTNALGQFSLKLGTGLSTGSGSAPSFASINWGATAYFLKTEINPGTGFVVLGTDQLSSVPFALHSKTTSALPAGSSSGQVLSWNGTSWVATSICSLLNQYYRDTDNDGYGDPNTASSVRSCYQPSGFSANNLDCNDTSSIINPLTNEICNGLDDNCDGITDNASLANVSSDPNNCGACGAICPTKPNSSRLCTGGICNYVCNPGFADCNNNMSDGCEKNLLTDPNNCNGCNLICPPAANSTPICAQGICDLLCTGSFGNCDLQYNNGCETNLNTNLSNCGACGTICSPRANASVACNAGICTYVCSANFRNCNNNMNDGCEIDIRNNTANCGNCGLVCTAPNANMTCNSGVCFLLSCSAGFANCNSITSDGCETNVSSDVNNCNGCGVVCATRPNTTKSCTNGVCTYVCTAGKFDCNATMTDGCESSTPCP